MFVQNASGQSSVTGNNSNQQQQQQFASFMLQQQQQQHQMLMQQYSMAAAAQQLGQWSVNSNGADPSSPSNRQVLLTTCPDMLLSSAFCL